MSGVELQEAIKNKAIELGDKLRDNLALDSIAKAQIIETLGKFESYVLAVLADHVVVPRKPLKKQYPSICEYPYRCVCGNEWYENPLTLEHKCPDCFKIGRGKPKIDIAKNEKDGTLVLRKFFFSEDSHYSMAKSGTITSVTFECVRILLNELLKLLGGDTTQ